MSDSVEWDEIAKRLLEPQDRTQTVKLDVESATRRQIESAILLWFLDADIGSIYTLTRASLELVCNAATKAEKPLMWQSKIESWKSWPKPLQKLMNNYFSVPQNYLKHGPDRNQEYEDFFEELDRKTVDGMLHIAAGSYVDLYCHVTPLILLFQFRFYLENPTRGRSPGKFFKIDAKALKKLPRSEFLIATAALAEETLNTAQR